MELYFKAPGSFHIIWHNIYYIYFHIYFAGQQAFVIFITIRVIVHKGLSNVLFSNFVKLFFVVVTFVYIMVSAV